MSAYTGYLIRRERLNQNLSQEGLSRGICAPSYLSKIEAGQVEPRREIVDRLFGALGVEFIRDEALLREAQRQLEAYFFHIDAGGRCEAAETFLMEQGERLERSEFALSCAVYRLYSACERQDWEEAARASAWLKPFSGCLDAPLRQRVLIARAKMQERPEDAIRLLEEANALLHQKLAMAYLETGNRQEAMRHLERAEVCFETIDGGETRERELLGVMLRFVRLRFEPACDGLPEYEQVLTRLYAEAGQALGHGFSQFYGRHLIALYRKQRRYKDALGVSEALGIGGLSLE